MFGKRIYVGAWLSLVERFLREEEVLGSNPSAPTISIADFGIRNVVG